eukprot:gene20812-27647_t
MPSKSQLLNSLASLEAKAQKLAQTKEKSFETSLREHLNDREELCQRRYELVKGSSTPTAEELKGYSGPTAKVGSKGIPLFWLNVLLGHVLRRGLYLEKDKNGKAIRMREETTQITWKDGHSLLEKEVSSSKKVKKETTQTILKDVHSLLVKEVSSSKKVKKAKKGKKGSAIEDEEAKKGKKSKKGAALEDEEVSVLEGPKKYKAAPSFFRFFLPSPGASGKKNGMPSLDPTALDPTAEEEASMLPFKEDEESEEEEDEGYGSDASGEVHIKKAPQAETLRKQKDAETLELLVKRVIPRAVHLYLESPMQMVVHALQGVQGKMDDLALRYKTEKWQAMKVEYVGLQELADERRKLLEKGASEGGPTSVPNFWLRALRSQDSIVHAVAARDEKLLACLADVRMVWDWSRLPSLDNPRRTAVLELHFLPNPYVSNEVLRKSYTFTCVEGSIRRLALSKGEVLDPPMWQEGKDLTVRPPLSKGSSSKPRPAPSFFCIFKKGASRQAFNITGVKSFC